MLNIIKKFGEKFLPRENQDSMFGFDAKDEFEYSGENYKMWLAFKPNKYFNDTIVNDVEFHPRDDGSRDVVISSNDKKESFEIYKDLEIKGERFYLKINNIRSINYEEKVIVKKVSIGNNVEIIFHQPKTKPNQI